MRPFKITQLWRWPWSKVKLIGSAIIVRVIQLAGHELETIKMFWNLPKRQFVMFENMQVSSTLWLWPRGYMVKFIRYYERHILIPNDQCLFVFLLFIRLSVCFVSKQYLMSSNWSTDPSLSWLGPWKFRLLFVTSSNPFWGEALCVCVCGGGGGG